MFVSTVVKVTECNINCISRFATFNKFWVRTNVCIYRVSHELRSLLRESVPYVKIYRYNPKHLCPKLNGYGDNGQRKVCTSWGCTHYMCQLAVIYVLPCVGCHVTEFLLMVARSQEHSSVMYSASNPKDNNDRSANVFVLQFNGFMSLTSYFDVKYRY